MALSMEGIKISDVRLVSPPPLRKGDKLKIEIKYDNETTTDTQSAFGRGDQENSCMIWSESFIFAGYITDDTLVKFTVQKKGLIKNNDTVGSCECRAIRLIEQQGDSGLCKLDVIGESQLTFNIKKISRLDLASGAIERASAGLGSLPILKAPAKGANVSVARVYNDNEKIWMSFLDTFKVFMEVMRGVSEVNMYAQAAWSVLSIIPKTIIAKKNSDDKIKQLCEKLKDIYEYITDVERLCDLAATQSTDRPSIRWSKMLSTLVQQTIECAHFIRAYCAESTVANIVKAIGGSVDDKIQALNDKLDHLAKVMTDSINLEIGIVTLRMSQTISEKNELILLGEMPYDPEAGFLSNKRCLIGTRQTLINEILTRVNDDNLPQILVLSGQAGVGKSSVAHTIAGIFQKQNRLGSMFCFNRSFPDRRNFLFSSISRDLADSDTQWRKELVKVIDKSAVRKTKDAETQFEELILKPSRNVTTIGSVVVVVDALDESGERNERREILKLLLDRWNELPGNYRIIVTTRPEQDIELQCLNCNVQCIRMGGIQDAEETCSDIQAYVSDCLAPISSILDKINRDWPSILAQRAEGLFQWAQTVCQFIDPTVRRPQLVKKKWKACISNSSSSLYELYRQIISTQSETKDEEFLEDFRTIVGAIITAREPLSINALQNIFSDIEDIESILTPFGSFFVGVHDLSTPVRPVHTSLSDFFVSKKITEENNKYYIDISDQSQMTLCCLKVMNRMLCFNICQLETSHQRNQDVPDFYSRVEKAVPSHLSYSCCFWTFHLQSSPVSGEIIREVRRLMDDKLLYYFEALSLIKAVDRGCVTMREIANWCKDADDALAKDATDAWRFGFDFRNMMVESTSHLYLSALPFVPRNSFVSRKYLERYPGVFTLDADDPVNSSREINFRLEYLGYSATVLAFSPKGTYFAFASSMVGLRVSKMSIIRKQIMKKTSEAKEFHRPFSTGSRPVHIIYSFDGEWIYCCFSNGNILAFHTGTKEERIETYEEILGPWCRHCAISSDGCFIIWTTQKEALLFDRRTRQIVKRFENRQLSAISPNGDWIALYSSRLSDEVYIWNTRSQTQHCVMSCYAPWDLALSDRYIAFRINDTTIEIWDVWTITKVTELIGSETYIGSLCLSPENRYFIVTSASMYSIWSVSTGQLISRSHVDNLDCCLGFSHDSKSIALLSESVDREIGKVTLHVEQWDEFIEQGHPPNNEIERVYEIWLRGSYLILHYETILDEGRLRISDITTTNTIIFEVKLKNYGCVGVSPNEENVRVAYVTSRGLCLWNDKEGEIVVDANGSVRSITALLCWDKYLISAHERTINIWDSCTRDLVRGIMVDLLGGLKPILPVRDTRFAVIYDHKAEIRDCESGDRLKMLALESKSRRHPIAVSANEKHLIYASKGGINIELLTRARMGVDSIPFSRGGPNKRPSTSLNGKYMVWIDNDEIQLFDVDTETFFSGPSLDHPIKDFWLSDDSRCIITASGEDIGGNPEFLDIWDIQTKNMIKKIRYPSRIKLKSLVFSKRRLVVLTSRPSQCHVWDLDTYEIMSTLYSDPSLANEGSDIEGTPTFNKTDLLDYALMSWRKASLSASVQINRSGWVYGPKGELLFWIPPKLRNRFWLPCVTHVPHRNFTKPNFTNFVHGLDWTKCKSGNN